MNTSVPSKHVAVIMAGGSGERFWPLSRRDQPKQLLRLSSPDKTMLDEAVGRALCIAPVDRVYIQTTETLQETIRAAAPGTADGHPVPPGNVLAEPAKRNTAGCLAYAAAYLLAEHGAGGEEITMAVLTADHQIGTLEQFKETALLALDVAEKEAALVTIGIVPRRPATGYGYVQALAKPGRGSQGPSVFPVKAFHEKPDLERAKKYANSRDFYWNSGMFFWRVSTFLAELDVARPNLSHAVREMAAAMTEGDEASVMRIFEGLEDISIDYALMEKTQHASVVRATFAWDDIGTWTALDRVREADVDGNIAQGDPVLVGCKNTIVYNAAGAARAVSVVGAEDLVVVVTEDAVLVVPKERTEDVKKAVEELKRRGSGAI